jgi:hypothetical protein
MLTSNPRGGLKPTADMPNLMNQVSTSATTGFSRVLLISSGFEPAPGKGPLFLFKSCQPALSLGDRQTEEETTPLPLLTPGPDAAVVGLDDVAGDR